MNDDLEDEIDLYYNKWLAAKQRAERLESGPGGIMEMKQTIADKEKRIEQLEAALIKCRSTLSRAFSRIHVLPRITDTKLAEEIGFLLAELAGEKKDD